LRIVGKPKLSLRGADEAIDIVRFILVRQAPDPPQEAR
jgi:hypothetical protein